MKPGTQIPAVMFIEMALDMFKDQSADTITRELKEFRALGTRMRDVQFPDGCTDAEKGYLIGIETARALLATMANAVTNKVTI